MTTEFNIFYNPNELEGTAYIEFLPGKYKGKCWNENSIFMDETTYAIFEDIIESLIEDYDHYAFNEFPETKLSLLISLLKERRDKIQNDSFFMIDQESNPIQMTEWILEEMINNKEETIKVLEGFIIWIQHLKKQNIPLSILGI